ncbi:ASCH domain-containing protein [Halorubrum vacuolatum]|uniref:ASCH domain-containing protein n=1 Tax=Halorubrum vacuolatum TaxID=63740 RepID=A0A238VC37_HALVU|nr:ASCH domain-containing protein [Halorubrum vacuolatum]SNR31816.1 hypothetical protein SAMN06264855_102229 [Halorubrum vacuolatum]
MSTLDPDTLLPNEHVKEAAVRGEITQLHRGNRYADPGDTFEVDGITFEITDVAERTLGEMTDADARREGSPSLEAYKERMVRVHGGNFEWDDDATVVRHQFEQR